MFDPHTVGSAAYIAQDQVSTVAIIALLLALGWLLFGRKA